MQNYIQDLLGSTHHTFLQGSYKNDTSISDINDVDIVAIRLTTYSSVYSGRRFPSSISWDAIFNEIEEKLRGQRRYNWTVSRDDKCIKVRGAFNADVVPAVQVKDDHFLDPIAIYSFKTPSEKLNYPRIHYDNGVKKHAATNKRCKPTVRLFKNWVENHFSGNKEIISSFKIEALLHGTSNDKFTDDSALNFLLVAHDITQRLNTQTPICSSVCGFENVASNWNWGREVFKNSLGESLKHAIDAYEATSEWTAEEK